eukprot:4851358-Amphidinium_carterae.1
MSCFYRLWSAYRLRTIPSEVFDNFPIEMRGGLPGRDYAEMLAAAMLNLEAQISGVGVGEPSTFQMVTLDSRKCFDLLHHATVLDAAQRVGIDNSILVALGSLWTTAERTISMSGQLAPNKFRAYNGIPQGCAISVIVCNALVATWIHRMRQHDVIPAAFVDDRNI